MVTVAFKNGKEKRFNTESEARQYERKSHQKILSVKSDDIINNEALNGVFTFSDAEMIKKLFDGLNPTSKKDKPNESQFQITKRRIKK
jgi:hypothetical protein